MLIYKCDRCKKEIKGQNKWKVLLANGRHVFKTYHFCDEDWEEVKDLINNQ